MNAEVGFTGSLRMGKVRGFHIQAEDFVQGVTDPEQKRKTIGAEFIENFKDFADSLVKKGLPKPKFLVQGTLYPDVIESCPPPGSNQKHSHTIKSHHNVGGLPKDLQFTLIEPLKELFKVISISCLPCNTLHPLLILCLLASLGHLLLKQTLLLFQGMICGIERIACVVGIVVFPFASEDNEYRNGSKLTA